MTTLAEYKASRELFTNLTLRDLRAKYKRSFFGWAWSLANPIAMTVVYTVVFRYFLRTKGVVGHPSGLNNFAVYLLCGLLPFTFFLNGVNSAMGSVIGNAALIKKSYFERELLPISSITANLVSHFIEMALLLTVVLVLGNFRALEYLPITLLAILLVMAFTVGLGLLFATFNVFFRDVEYFASILFTIWFYATPIVYPLVLVKRYQTILKINPMTDAVQSFRATLYDGTHPGWYEFGYLAIASLVMLVAGLLVFNKLKYRFAEEL
jgi:lipopolysaccharide transport system permease protein